MIKAIVFDYAGVIGPGALLGWVKEHATEENRMLEIFRQHSDEWDLGQVNDEAFQALISKITGIAPENVWDVLYEPSNHDPEMIELVKRLKEKYIVVLFSDNYAPFLRKLLQKLQILDLFDEVIISSDYHLKKTDPKFYDVLFERLKVKNDEIIFTDDTKGNIDVAQSLGIHAIHFQSPELLVQKLKEYGVIME